MHCICHEAPGVHCICHGTQDMHCICHEALDTQCRSELICPLIFTSPQHRHRKAWGP